MLTKKQSTGLPGQTHLFVVMKGEEQPLGSQYHPQESSLWAPDHLIAEHKRVSNSFHIPQQPGHSVEKDKYSNNVMVNT